MTITEVTTETIFESHLQAAHVLKNMRSSLCPNYFDAINMHIVIASACYVEGYLENLCRDLLAEYAASRNRLEVDYPDEETRIRLIRFYQRLEDDLDARVRKATGIEHYIPLMEILMGEKLSKDEGIKGYYEGIIILFTLRNMFAHGRLFEKKVLIRAPKMPDQDARTNFLPGYGKAIDFLAKQKLIKNEKAEIKLKDIASNVVADYFLDLAEKFCSKIPEFKEKALYVPSIEEWLEETFSEYRDAYNAEHNTNYTSIDLLRKDIISIRIEPFSKKE